MTQVLPASLVAPTRAGQSVGYQIRAVDGTTIATAFTTTGVTEEGTTGYYRVNGGITAPDDGGVLEWYLNNAGAAGTFLSAVAIEPVPANFTDMAITASTGQVTVGTLNSNVITAGSIASGAITNAKFAAGAIDAAAIATDAVTEIQAGLATQVSVDTKASQASVDTLNAKADDITALVL